MLLGGCASSGSDGAGSSASSVVSATSASSEATPSWDLVILGDSLSRASSCPGCTDLVTLFARKLSQKAGVSVRVDSRAAQQLSNVPAAQVTMLYADILTDASLRKAVRGAEVIVIMVGFNDTPWNRLDNPCEVAPNFPVVQWTRLTSGCIRRVVSEYKRSLDQTLTEIDRLRGCGAGPGIPPCSQRGASDTLLRIVTVYNSTIGDKVDPGWDSPDAIRPTVLGNDLMVHAQCEVIRFHGGRCADIYHRFNGPRGRKAAGANLVDFTHLSQRGHNVAAEELIKLGLAPLQ